MSAGTCDNPCIDVVALYNGGGGGGGTLAATLLLGNTTDGSDIVLTNGSVITSAAQSVAINAPPRTGGAGYGVQLNAGTSDVKGGQGDVRGGNATGAGAGGDVNIEAGTAPGSGNGGDLFLNGGFSLGSGNDGKIEINAHRSHIGLFGSNIFTSAASCVQQDVGVNLSFVTTADGVNDAGMLEMSAGSGSDGAGAYVMAMGGSSVGGGSLIMGAGGGTVGGRAVIQASYVDQLVFDGTADIVAAPDGAALVVRAGVGVWEGREYTVSPIPGAARFQTIQAAIDQAQSDGASFATPAVIFVAPGIYNENLTITAPSGGGGLSIRGVADSWQTYIDGTLTVNNGGSQNMWSFSEVSFAGAVNFVGTSSNYQVWTNLCEFYSRVTVQQAGCVWKDYYSFFRSGAADPLLFSGASGLCEFVGSRFNAGLANRSLLVRANFRQCYVIGRVQVTGSAATLQNSAFYATTTCLTDATTTTSELLGCQFFQTGTPAIDKTGAGILRTCGSFISPAATMPFIAVGAGSVQVGVLLT